MKYLCILIILIIGLNAKGQIYHEVKKKETLWTISKNYFGTGHEYVKIWQNSKTIGLTDDPDLIYPGMILQIHTDTHFTVPVPEIFDTGSSVKNDTVIIYLEAPTAEVKKNDNSVNIQQENGHITSSRLGNILFLIIVALIAAFLVERYVSKKIRRNTK